MSILPRFRFPSTLHRTVVVPRPCAPPLMACLDFRVPTSDDSEDIGSLHANPDDSESQSGRANMDDSESQSGRANTDDSESEGGGSHPNTPDNAKSPATSMSIRSFKWDQDHSYSLEWADLAEFKLWRQTEERLSSIEFVASTTRTNGVLWSRWQRFVCRCQVSGGEKIYERRHLEWKRKTKTKKSGCGCHIDIKQYPHTSTVLGRYAAEHDHEIGAANIAYTCLSGDTWEQIKTMLTQKINCREIVSCRTKNSLAAGLIHLKVRVIRNTAPRGSHDRLIALKEVNQIAQVLDNHKIRLHPDDAIATRLVMDELSAQGHLIFYKDKQDRTPIHSRLPEDAFVLCLQTNFQLDSYRRLGGGFIGIDATHNITQYQDLLLFTIITRDHWGHGK